MKIEEHLAKSIEDLLSFEGISLEIPSRILGEINDNSFLHEVSTYIKSGDIKTYTASKNVNQHLLLSVLIGMLQNGEVTLNFTEKASDMDINYLKKLTEQFQGE